MKRGDAALWAAYLATRLGAVLVLLLPRVDRVLIGLTHPYQALASAPFERALLEYPWMMAALLDVPRLLGASAPMPYIAAWILIALAADAGFAWRLWSASGRRATPGVVLWILLVPALGPLAFTMFDLFPAIACALALLAAANARSRIAGAWLAAAGAMKLWPLAGFPALALTASGRERRAMLLTALGVGAAAVLATLASGPQRLWSPLLWHASRGLQVEAVPALPLLWAREWLAGGWTTLPGDFNSIEIKGPGVVVAIHAASIALLLAVGAMAVLHWRAFRAPAHVRTPALSARLLIASVLVLVLTSKVFSPQYTLWLAAPLAALGTLPGGNLRPRDVALLLGACALTQLVFPFQYDGLVLEGHTRAWVLLALTARDALLIVLWIGLFREAWRASKDG